jgi:DNA-binding response OmpR family regulator
MKKIIIADNIKAFLDKEKSMLHRASFKIFTATSNEEALEVHSAEKADLIITKLDMPGMNGDKLCSIIRRNKELCNVSIILVCSDTEADIERSSRCKANDYITTPLIPHVLIDKTVRLLSIPKRESFRVLVSAEVEGTFERKSFLCNLVNLSVSGMMIVSSKNLSKGDRISCSFFLPHEGRITLEGNIVRVSSRTVDLHEYGIRFANLSFDTKSVIEAFVKGKM